MAQRRVSYTHTALDGRYKPMGRVRQTEKGIAMSWSASGLSFACSASRLVFFFAPYTQAQPVAVRLCADRYSVKYMLGGECPVIVFDTPEEIPHTVTLLRLSEGAEPLCLTGMELWGEAPSLLLPPPPLPHRLLFVGDSLTCGFGTESQLGDNAFHTWEEDATHACPFRTAAALAADYQIISISGQGLHLNAAGQRGIPFSAFWQRPEYAAAGEKEQSGFVPDAVVINGGTNDVNGGADPSDFREAVRDFLLSVRAAYPEAEIVWYYGMMTTALSEDTQAVIRALADPKITYLPAETIKADDPQRCGTLGHPTSAAHEEAAQRLAAYLRRRMGW